MKNKQLLLYGVSLLVLTGVIVGIVFFQQSQHDGLKDSPLRIASVLALTGPAGHIGAEIQRGQQLAEAFWDSKGVSLDIKYQDCKGLPKEGLTAFQSVRLQGYRLVIAHTSGVSLAIKAQVDPSKEFVLALGSHPAITSPPNPSVYLYSQTVSGEVSALLDWLDHHPEFDHMPAVLIHSEDDYGKAFADLARNRLGDSRQLIVASYRNDDLPDMRTFLAANLPAGSFIPIVVGSGKPMGQVIATLRERGYNGAILTNIGYALTGVKDNLGADAGNIVYLMLEVKKGKYTHWAAINYRKRFNKDITPEAIIGFNSISLLAKAVGNSPDVSITDVRSKIPKVASELLDVTTEDNDIPVKLVVHEQ